MVLNCIFTNNESLQCVHFKNQFRKGIIYSIKINLICNELYLKKYKK